MTEYPDSFKPFKTTLENGKLRGGAGHFQTWRYLLYDWVVDGFQFTGEDEVELNVGLDIGKVKHVVQTAGFFVEGQSADFQVLDTRKDNVGEGKIESVSDTNL